MDEFAKLYADWLDRQRAKNPISGYCPCCGFTHYRDMPEEHDYSCIWFKEKKDG